MSDFTVILGPPPIQVTPTLSPPLIQITPALSQQGIPGPTGPRGIGWVGVYAGAPSLPPIDESNVKDGDLALTTDGTVWRVQ